MATDGTDVDWVPEKLIDINAVESMLQASVASKQFTNAGPNVMRLEANLREILHIHDDRAVVATANASCGLQLAAAAVSCENDAPWITQSFTFPPSAQGNLSSSIILDIDEEGGLDLSLIDSTRSLAGIIVTNIFGNVVDIDKYVNWADTHKCALIFDNAATPYTWYKGSNVLNYGTASVVSFHHTKPFGFGEGGAVIIERQYERILRCLMNFGIGLGPDYYSSKGTNGKMSDIAAVYVMQHLRNVPHIVAHHTLLHQYFVTQVRERGLDDYVHMFPTHDPEAVSCKSCICILVAVNSKKIVDALVLSGVSARKYYVPLCLSPVATRVYNQIVCIPCNTDMRRHHIDHVCDVIAQQLARDANT